MAQRYSRKASLEQKRNIRKAIVLTLTTIILVSSFIIYGIPLVVRYTGLILDIKSSESPIKTTDHTAPPPPRIDLLPEFTNQEQLDVNGTAEAGSVVKINFNGTEKEILANKSGRFSTTIKLNENENSIFATAKDASGNTSIKTKGISVIYDKTPPKLEITKPESGSSIYGASNKRISIEGSTEPDSNVWINEKFIIIRNDGSFAYSYTLTSGENKFKIKSEDRAGNATESEVSVNFSE